jgi:acrylyl-CoA reductase (NADPH)
LLRCCQASFTDVLLSALPWHYLDSWHGIAFIDTVLIGLIARPIGDWLLVMIWVLDLGCLALAKNAIEVRHLQSRSHAMSSFKALMVHRDEDKTIRHEMTELQHGDLPADGEVLVAVKYSTVNYKDGLCLSGKGGLVRNYPHIPGIDFAGEVVSSSDKRYKQGDLVALTGWRVGEIWWGGYAQFAKVRADWLVPLVDGLDCQQAMAIGTAGMTAMLSVLALEDAGVTPDKGPVLVTGAAGGVGSVATALLAARGYSVTAVTGRPETADYLRGLGASDILLRADMLEGDVRLLESASWSGCIDSVGSSILARALAQMQYGGVVATVGNAGGADLPTSVMPFIIRGVSLLGIDSAMAPYDRRIAAWNRLASDLPKPQLLAATTMIGLDDVSSAGADILAGKVQGRLVVDVNA